MNSASRATVLTVTSEIHCGAPCAPDESGQKKPLQFPWLDVPSPHGKTRNLLDRLESENAKLRARVVELVLEIQALRRQ
jgi:hypothetical protein